MGSSQAAYSCCDATTDATSTPINTGGATLLVVMVHTVASTAGFALTDSYNNAWNGLGWTPAGGSNHAGYTQIYYAYNPAVGPNHTFHLHAGVAASYIRGVMQAYSGTLTTGAVYDSGSFNFTWNENATSTAAGSAAPSQAGDVFVTSWSSNRTAGSGAVSAPFTADQSILGNSAASMQSGYYISADASAQNPVWSEDTAIGLVADIAAFKAASTGSGGSADTQAPTVPANLSATAVSASAINLSWSASADNVGVAGYTIYRGGVQIGTSAGNSYSDTGLTPLTQYTYTVSAYDAAGNSSAQSTAASATTQAISGNRVDLLDSSGSLLNTYATIQACASAMAAGQTCKVYAGTYNENVSVPAGTAGNYKILTVNPGDTANVWSFTINSHVKINGFTITNPASPHSGDCLTINGNSADFYITNNIFYACGSHSMIYTPSGFAATGHGFIQNNKFSYSCSTSGAPNVCTVMEISASYMLLENNDISHVSDGPYIYGAHNVLRKNTFHDINSADCGSNSGNCHVDFMQADANVPGGSQAAQYMLIEGNIINNLAGSDTHAMGLFQAEACNGQCFNAIVRFNAAFHFGSGGILDDNSFTATPPAAWDNVKSYNNSWVDGNNYAGNQLYGGTNAFNHGSTGGAEINDLFYYAGSLADFNPYSTDAGTVASFAVGHNLAYCAAAPCNLHGKVYSSGSFTDDPGNILANPDFVNYAGNNFYLSAGSPAIGAGTYLTTVATGDSGSGTSLAVNDAGFFQDGSGIPGVQPDWIAVGSAANIVQISSINYAANIINLAAPITRAAGAPVYLYKDSGGDQVLFGAAADIGAFPYSGGGSATPLPGDINLDHIINSLDYSIMNSHWFQNYSLADLNSDSIVNSLDFAILKSNWGKTW